MTDSHCHLDSERFTEDLDAVIDRALSAGVERMMSIGTGDGPPDIEVAVRIADKYDAVYSTVGVHPHDASKYDDSIGKRLADLLQHPKVLALGEIGLDYHYDFAPRDVQRDVFAAQIALACERDLPVIIHTREATADTIAVLKEAGHGRVRGVFHCFSGSREEAVQGLDLGFYISLSGILTFPKAGSLRDTAAMIPADRLLVETDAPFLAPVPHRGKRNEPAFLAQTVAALAAARGTTIDALASQLARNYADFVGGTK